MLKQTTYLIRITAILIGLMSLSLPLKAYDISVDDKLFFDIISTGDLTCKLAKVSDDYVGELTVPGQVEFKGRTLTVTAIGQKSIASCSSLTKILLNSNITEFEPDCFAGCKSLEEADLSAVNTTKLPTGGFKDCSALKRVKFPTGIDHLPDSVFYACENLEPLTIPTGVTSIGNSCFSYAKIPSITLPNTLSNIGARAFDKTTTPSIFIPSSVTFICNNCFADSNIPTIEFSEQSNIVDIPDWCFKDSRIENVTLPPNLQSLGKFCFADCIHLNELEIPATIEFIDYGVFANSRINELKLISENNIKFHETAFSKCFIKRFIFGFPYKPYIGWGHYLIMPTISELVITNECAFIYLSFYYEKTGSGNRSNILFKNNQITKCIINDYNTPLDIFKLDARYDSNGNPTGYIDEIFYSSKENLKDTWLSTVKDLYIGREINGNPIYAPNLAKLTIGNVPEVDVEGPFPALQVMESLADTPPVINSSYFSTYQFIELPVIVPDNAIEKYRAAEGWKNFWNLMTHSEYTGITNTVSHNKVETARYDLFGNKVDENYKGFIIKVYSNGEREKVLVK